MREILASALLYLCPFALFVGPYHSALALIVALSIPPRLRGSAERKTLTRQDCEMPVWEFDEAHESRVNADAFAAFQAVLDTTADEILLYQTLTGIRRMFGSGGASGTNILRAAGDRPILESAEKGGFERLLAIPGQELLMAAKLGESIRVTMNFTFPEGRVRTETRVHASNPRARWLFAWYWRIIFPGSSLIRYMWLRGIRLRAEKHH